MELTTIAKLLTTQFSRDQIYFQNGSRVHIKSQIQWKIIIMFSDPFTPLKYKKNQVFQSVKL